MPTPGLSQDTLDLAGALNNMNLDQDILATWGIGVGVGAAAASVVAVVTSETVTSAAIGFETMFPGATQGATDFLSGFADPTFTPTAAGCRWNCCTMRG
jgi:hypothetical protein